MSSAKLRAAQAHTLCRDIGPHDGVDEVCVQHTEDAVREADHDAHEQDARLLEIRASELDGPWGVSASPENYAIAKELRRLVVAIRSKRMK